MRITNFVAEAIINPPTNLRHFVTSRLGRLRAAQSAIVAAGQSMSTTEEGERLLDQMGNYMGLSFYDYAYWLERYSRAGGSDRLGNMIHSVESYAQYGPTFLHYVLSAAEEFRDMPLGADDLARFAEFDQRMIDYGFETAADENSESRACRARFAAINSGMHSLRDFYAIAQELELKLAPIASRAAAAMGGENWRPEHDEVETLYHTTAYTSEIVEHGFLPTKPSERRGLGLYGTQAGISMTHSLNIAMQISRCLKELCLIAHGQLGRKQIMSWIEQEGLVDDVTRAAGGQSIMATPDSIEWTATLYNHYLWFTKIRQNPVFTHIERVVNDLKTRSVADIGVLACQVRLDGTEEYKAGESEFIVRPDQVEAIRRTAH